MQPRLKTEIWAIALIRRCAVADVQAVLVRRGDASAGVVLVKVNRLGDGCTVYAPTNTGDGTRAWMRATGSDPVEEAEADAYIERQVGYDPDLWVIEIEDRDGRHFLQEPVQ